VVDHGHGDLCRVGLAFNPDVPRDADRLAVACR
jgi:hypothetical protein